MPLSFFIGQLQSSSSIVEAYHRHRHTQINGKRISCSQFFQIVFKGSVCTDGWGNVEVSYPDFSHWSIVLKGVTVCASDYYFICLIIGEKLGALFVPEIF